MSRQQLSKARILELWQGYDPHAWGEGEWWDHYTEELEWAASRLDEQLRGPADQQRIWHSKHGKWLGTAGPSRGINVAPLIADTAFVADLVQTRRRSFDPAPSRRAVELQETYDKLTARMEPMIEGNQPRLRLMRAMHWLRPGDFVCCWTQKSLYAVRDFLVGKRGLGVIENHVLIRARLRDVLGDESDMREHAKRSIFCWWLWEQADEIAEGLTPVPKNKPSPQPPLPDKSDDELPKLALLPLQRQHRWLDMYKGGLDTLRLVLRECLEPQTMDLLVSAVEDELNTTSSASRYLTSILRDLRRLGLIKREGDAYRTTDDGESVLDTGGLEVLAQALVIRLKGFAHVLQALEGGIANSADLHEVLRPFGTEASLRYLVTRHLWWAQEAGLVDKTSHTGRKLSPAGKALLDQLPDELEVPAEKEDGEAFEEDPVEVIHAELPEFPALWAHLDTRARKQGMVFSAAQALSLHSAWRFGERTAHADKPPKRFAILSGLSGTGKTQLLLQYAKATCELAGLDPEQHLLLVPVRPDWRDPTGLLGYLNALHAEPTFQAEPALELLIRAAEDPGRPYFLLLDEMNLARVEHYFAPFLSAMETGVALELHASDESISGVPPRIRWPANLRIGGTVNMDESTHAFSDKVLDRAFTLEFWEVDLASFFAARTHRDAFVEEALLAFQGHLRGIRRHVGYRTAGEVLDWVAHAVEAANGAVPKADILDQALFSKVLPRVRGMQTRAMSDALGALLKESESRGLGTCAAKVRQMRDRLEDTGVTGFWA